MRGRRISLAVFVLAAVVWLAGIIMNRSGCLQCFVLTPPLAVEEPAVQPGQAPHPVVSPAPTTPLPIPAPPVVTPVLSWDDTRDDILRSSASSEDKANRFLALLPQLSGEAQEEAARHTANLLGDDHFLTAAACFTNASAPTNILAIFMGDLLNRPEKVKLPLCLAVARNEQHPCAAPAKEILDLHFPDGPGTNWPAWETAIQDRLKPQQ